MMNATVQHDIESEPTTCGQDHHALSGEIPSFMRRLHEADICDPHRFLDTAALQLQHGDVRTVQRTMDILSDGLWWIRKTRNPSEWAEFVLLSQLHPIRQLLHQDEFTRRSFTKPRGYAGDAVLLDLIYYDICEPAAGSTSALGAAIYSRNKDTPAPMAVRERRDFMAELIDQTTAETTGAHILAVACGHLREGRISCAVQRSAFGRFVALDQDVASLEVVEQEFGAKGVESLPRTIKSALKGSFAANSFDLVYAAGLYDYLQDRFAEALTQGLFRLLRPGGRLVVGNFVPDIFDAGYMETYMGWKLLFRDLNTLASLSCSVPDADVAMRRTYTRRCPDVAYLELRKRTGIIPVWNATSV